jgi:hypothetical protein
MTGRWWPGSTNTGWPDERRRRMTAESAAARGKAIAESGKHLPPKGAPLGRIEAWGLDVYEGSPQPWIDAWLAEVEARR